MRRVALAAAVSVAAVPCLIAARQQPQTPAFRSAVDLVVVDAQVVDRGGAPILTLKPSDFEVTINGKKRQVVTADLVTYAQTSGTARGATAAVNAPLPAAPRGAPPRGRVFALAVDEGSFLLESMKPAMRSTQRFIDQLQPDDLVGVYVYPFSAPKLELTRDHAKVRQALDKLVGRLDAPPGEISMTPAEMIDITATDSRRNTPTLDRVVSRECPEDQTCRKRVINQAFSNAGVFEGQVAQSLSALQELFRGLGAMPGRKTVVLVSGGLMGNGLPGGRPNIKASIVGTGKDSAAANIGLYILHMDNSFAEAFSAVRASSRRPSDRFFTLMRDADAFGAGLEEVAGETGASLMRIRGTSGDYAFDRVLKETTAYYLLGVETIASDRNGKIHFIRMKVKAKGAEVQHRMQVVIPRGGE